MASTKWHCIALMVLFSVAMCSAHKVKPLTSAIIANKGGRKIRILADITENHHDDHDQLNHPTMAGGNDGGLGSSRDGYSHKNNKCAGSHAGGGGGGGGAIPGYEGNTPIGGGGYGYGSGSGDGSTGGGGGGGGWSGNAPGYGGYPGSGGFGYGGGYGSGGDDGYTPPVLGPGFPIPGMSGVDGSFNCLPSTCGTPFTPCTGFTLHLTNHGPMMASTTTPSPSPMTSPVTPPSMPPTTSPVAPPQMPPRDMDGIKHHHLEQIMPSMAPGYA